MTKKTNLEIHDEIAREIENGLDFVDATERVASKNGLPYGDVSISYDVVQDGEQWLYEEPCGYIPSLDDA